MLGISIIQFHEVIRAQLGRFIPKRIEYLVRNCIAFKLMSKSAKFLYRSERTDFISPVYVYDTLNYTPDIEEQFALSRLFMLNQIL